MFISEELRYRLDPVSYTGDYRESENYGLITEVKNDRTLVKIDGVSALKKYADWIGKVQVN